MKVYISGGITGVENYLHHFLVAQERLEKIGVEVINPARILLEMPKSTSYEEYIRVCIELINQCDEILMLNGWENSRGAVFEKHYAEIMGKGVIYEMSKLRC